MVTPELYALLALREQKMNDVVMPTVGMPTGFVTDKVKWLLVAYYYAKQQQLEELPPEQLINSQIISLAETIKNLREQAETAESEAEKQRLLAETEIVFKLQAELSEIMESRDDASE